MLVGTSAADFARADRRMMTGTEIVIKAMTEFPHWNFEQGQADNVITFRAPDGKTYQAVIRPT